MKKFFLALICLFFFMNIARAAENNSEFETAKERLFCALSSLASYSGDEGFLMRSVLYSRGWRIDGLTTQTGRANVKAYLISRDFDGKKVKILVIAGTEDLKDVEVDFRIGRVALHEGEEAGDETGKKIFVHRGFRDYTDTALAGGIGEYLVNDLKENPEEILYITGHSLGGAVALMSAIRLIDMGANSEQIKVISFGAPSIGNRALASAYEDKIDLTRISVKGDLIKKSLEILGYVHFGNLIEYEKFKGQDHYAHQMVIYLDRAMRNYYDAGGFEHLPDVDEKNKIDTPIYVAPIKILRKSFSEEDQKYILPLLRDGLESRLTNLTFAEPGYVEVKKAEQLSYDAKEFLEPARAAGCKFILVQFLQTKVIKEAQRREQRVTLDEMIFDSDGRLVSMHTAGATTKSLTLIEAAAFTQENLRENREKIFSGK